MLLASVAALPRLGSDFREINKDESIDPKIPIDSGGIRTPTLPAQHACHTTEPSAGRKPEMRAKSKYMYMKVKHLNILTRK